MATRKSTRPGVNRDKYRGTARGTAVTAVTITTPITAADAAHHQVRAEQALTLSRELAKPGVIESAADYQVADGELSELARLRKELKAMRQRALGPLSQAKREIESWFRPAEQALEEAIGLIKSALGEYRLAKEARERALEAAATAAVVDGGDARQITLELAESADELAATRATCRFVWRVATVDMAELEDEYKAPNMVALAEIARKAGSSEEPPVVKGVVFERVAQMGART